MSVATLSAPPLAATSVRPASGPYRFTLEQYHAMIRAGILGEDDRVELIAGYLTQAMSVNPPHAASVYRCTEWLRARIDGDTGMLFSERPISLPPHTEPEPDIVVAAHRADAYATAHPTPDAISLVVEVADDSLERDRKLKLPRYAEAGIAEYWIVNLRDRQLERYTEPLPARPEVGQDAAYAKTAVARAGEVLEHERFGEVAVDALLPVGAEEES